MLISLENEFSLPILIEDIYTYERLRLNDKAKYDQLDFLDRNFHPVIKDGIRFVKLESDNMGRREKSLYHDRHGKIIKVGVRGIKRIFDDHHRIIEQIYIDQSGNAMKDENGVASIRWEYDAFGNEIRLSYFDIQKKPFEAVDGMATTRWKYDKYGNKIETVFYDRFDNIVNATGGVAINTFAYDEPGNVITRSYYDSLRRPVPFQGHVKMNFFMDKEGFCKKEVFFKKDERDSIYLDFAVTYLYDPSGNMREQKRYDKSMKLAEENGIARYVYEYDGAHNNTSYQTYDAAGNPVAFSTGIARIKWQYNVKGEKIETRYFDVQGNLKGDQQHVAINRFSYDECGQILERTYYDSLDQLTDFDGVAVIKYNYDDHDGLQVEIKLDKNGRKVDVPMKSSSL
jgi:hypothetical protein